MVGTSVANVDILEPEVATVPANRPVPRRNSTLSDEAFKKLDEQLRQRPAADELIDKGILRGRLSFGLRATNVDAERVRIDSNVAPALQAATKQLERSQLEVSNYRAEKYGLCAEESTSIQDKIAKALTQRPGVDELVRDGILQGMIIQSQSLLTTGELIWPGSSSSAEEAPTV